MKAYRVIVADPPWPMKWNGGARRRNGRGVLYPSAFNTRSHRTLPYPTLDVEAISGMSVAPLAASSSMLFLWAPDSFVIDGSASAVCEAWGFTPQRFIVWAKRGYGLGRFPRPQHELVLVGKRGRPRLRRFDIGSVQTWKLVYEARGRSFARKHSAKPPAFLELIESSFHGPYLELFARVQRDGWDCWGNEVPSTVHLRVPEAQPDRPQLGLELGS